MSRTILISIMLFLSIASQAKTVSTIVVFGDSLSDNGNVAHLLRTLRKEEKAAYLTSPFKHYISRILHREATRLHIPESIETMRQKALDAFFDKMLSPMVVTIIHAIQTVPVIPVEPYWNYHFSNGKVWNEYFIDYLGLPNNIQSSQLLDNQAFGGAWAMTSDKQITFWQLVQSPFETLKNIIRGKLLPPSLGLAIESYLLDRGELDPNGLYVVFAGGNDYLNVLDHEENYNPPQMDKYVDNVVTSIVSSSKRLLGQGANKIVVVGVPDVAITPRFNQTSDREILAYATARHNLQLKEKIEGLNATLKDKTVLFINIQDMLQELIDNQNKYGFTDVTHACIDLPLPTAREFSAHPFKNNAVLRYAALSATQEPVSCDRPDTYLFWDEVHPTTRAHEILAKRVCSIIESKLEVDCVSDR